MENSLSCYLKESMAVLDSLNNDGVFLAFEQCVSVILNSIEKNKSILVCGNGGSASDAQHITGELIGRFLKERRAIKAFCLSSNPSVLTAIANDYGYDYVFERQVEAYGEDGGVIIGLSTSGKSQNVIRAFQKGIARNMTTIGFTGQGGGILKNFSNILIEVPSMITPLIQQAHILLYHHLCKVIEDHVVQKDLAQEEFVRLIA